MHVYIFESICDKAWLVVVKNIYKNDTLYDGIGLCAHNTNIILNSLLNAIGRVYGIT